MRTIRIGSGAGYSGDRIEPAIELAEKGDIQYLVFECLGERTVALAQQGTLGLVCDPLGGLVELPCVFRNATGAAIALAAVEMALAGITFAIPADEVIDTMGEIGREMDVRYRETAGGGLAATPTGRRLARELLVQIKRG